MKSTILAAILCSLLFTASSFAKGGGGHSSSKGSHVGNSSTSSGDDHSVKGYVKKDGTYVAPHQSTNPDGTKSNNWSTKGNVNPYTGKAGMKSE